MSSATPVEHVVEFLERHGYARIAEPLVVSGLEFEVPATLKGPAKSTDLILVADTAFESGKRIARKIQGIARALDVARSRRPLTAVIVGPRPTSEELENMSSVCRVLPIGRVDREKGESVLRNWLAVLTPLTLPRRVGDIADPESDLRSHLKNLDEDIVSIVDVASQGSRAVMERINEIISEALKDNSELGNG